MRKATTGGRNDIESSWKSGKNKRKVGGGDSWKEKGESNALYEKDGGGVRNMMLGRQCKCRVQSKRKKINQT